MGLPGYTTNVNSVNDVIIIFVQSKLISVVPRSRVGRKCSYIGNCQSLQTVLFSNGLAEESAVQF